MSKKKTVAPASGYIGGGSEPNSSAVELCRLMTEGSIPAISISYSGSGDSGDYNHAKVATRPVNKKIRADEGWMETEVDTPLEINDIAWKVIDHFINPDFNNDGCEGEVIFRLLKNGELKMHGEHRTFHTESDATAIDNILVDPADFV